MQSRTFKSAPILKMHGKFWFLNRPIRDITYVSRRWCFVTLSFLRSLNVIHKCVRVGSRDVQAQVDDEDISVMSLIRPDEWVGS